MKKLLVFLALGLSITLTGCADDSYVSVRHPENNEEVASVEENQTSEENKTQESVENEDTNEGEVTERVREELEEGLEFRVEDTVNMRLGPSQNSAIVAEVGPDDEILNLGETEGWTRVTSNGKTGYIRSDLLIKK